MDNQWKNCLEQIRQKTDFQPRIGIVLGSGLGDYGDQIQKEAVISYREIEGFPVSTVQGHRGQFVFGYIKGVPVVLMQGRVHYYEGYSMQEVVLPIRLMGLLGAGKLLLTNAAGGINTRFTAGDFMMITDQIATFVPSPLIGPNPQELGERFPDMSEIYDGKMQQKIRESARALGIPLQEGVYLQTSGPQYESPAEIRMMRALGADAVGMSTACEAIASRRHQLYYQYGIGCERGAIVSSGSRGDGTDSRCGVQEIAGRCGSWNRQGIEAWKFYLERQIQRSRRQCADALTGWD